MSRTPRTAPTPAERPGRTPHAPRARRDKHNGRNGRIRLAAAGCALLTAASAACQAPGRADAATRVRQAVERLGEWETVSATVRVEASADEIHAFLRREHERGDGPAVSRTDALLLSRMETAFVFGSDRPLKDLGDKDRLDTAAAVNFGNRDVAAYKSVGADFYVRADWKRLAHETNRSRETVVRAAGLARSADSLPPSLAAARDMLEGRWVQMDPEEFDHFARAVGGKYGERAQRLANSVDVLQSARAQHHVIGAVRRALEDHAALREAGRADGTERVRVTLPAREVADGLASALAPLEERFDGIGFSWLERAPDRRVTAELALRGGVLSGMTVDLTQFTGRTDAGEVAGEMEEIPLTVSFAPGSAVPVKAPRGARWLDPQDVMAAVLYEELGSPRP
ncbi:hypothetical protein IQ279_24585 [Streptomyces verrucosisporus]|uniref:hypothetical protein n=1 Tax=Streptomyces verrucosisporus TaxID=1695161 RepID=UPI0019D2BDE8|nr:hypothetical protein [Streptomyces verrucosisporus]MBN3932749.1 hypothetical protein [Streptomyces verrucosisporus]